jgi:hypothetical protein
MLTEAQVGAFTAGGVLPLPQLFAFDEIAWLREAAIALAQREGVTRDGRRFAPRTLRDVHHTEAGFRKLAAHPRLLEPVRQLASGAVVLRETRLCLGTGFDILANAAAEISAVVFLDNGSASRIGSALLVDGAVHYRDPRLSDSTLAFVATFAPSDARKDWTGEQLSAEKDDCLWQTPFLAAG